MSRTTKLEDAHLYLLQRAGHIARPGADAGVSDAAQDFGDRLDTLLAGTSPRIDLYAAADLIRSAWEAGAEWGAHIATSEGLPAPPDRGPGDMAASILILARERGGTVTDHDLIAAGYTRGQIAAHGEDAKGCPIF